jgi:hypothetical protein
MTTPILRWFGAGALSIVVAGCSNLPSPSPSVMLSPAPSIAPSPSPSPSATSGPTVTCDPVPDNWHPIQTPGSPAPTRLTCENAVAAAEAQVGDDSGITSIEFHYFFWCPPGYYCTITTANDGHVVFRVKGRRGDIVVQVYVDETGTVIASSPRPFPSPSS